jgi:dihydroneopterin aldolase
MIKKHSLLQLRELTLNVNLGWRKKERHKKQTVLLDLDLYFSSPPKACQTDKLEDTLCYHILIDKIREHIKQKNYALIEYLSYDIYHVVKNHFPLIKIKVCLTKFPRIRGLKGGARFYYGDPF